MARVVSHRETHKAHLRPRRGQAHLYGVFLAASGGGGFEGGAAGQCLLDGGGDRAPSSVNLGVAVSLGEQGLIVPVIKDAESEIACSAWPAVNDLAGRARARKLQPGRSAGRHLHHHQPRRLRLALCHARSSTSRRRPSSGWGAAETSGRGAPNRTPAGGVEDIFAIRPMVYLTLTFDHRMLDGAVGDAFLGKVVEALQHWGA